MSHCDEDTLSLLALGQSSSPPDARHLASCSECQSELEALRSVVIAARTEIGDVLVREDDGRDATEGTAVTRIPPPARVWERIAAATGVTTQARAEVVARGGSMDTAPAEVNGAAVVSPVLSPAPAVGRDKADVLPTAAASSGRDPSAGHVTATDAVTDETTEADDEQADAAAPVPAVIPVRPPRPRSEAGRSAARRDVGMLVGIAAVALIIGVLGGFGVSTWVQDRPDQAASPAVTAATVLAGLPLAPTAAGDATVVQTSTGRRLDIDVRRLDPAQGFYEVWLISPDITRMVSVGVLQGTTGDFALPEGIDLSQFPLVDISIQTYENNGAHSGKSVLRGTLRA